VGSGSRALLGTNDLDSTCAPPYDCTNYKTRDALVDKVASTGFGADAAAIVEYYSTTSELSTPTCASEAKFLEWGCSGEEVASDWTRMFWQITRDVGVSCPIQLLARKFANLTRGPPDSVFLYWEDLKTNDFGCTQDYHGGELNILFGNSVDAVPGVTRLIQDRWGSFVRGGAPWEAFSAKRDNFFSIGYPAETSAMGSAYGVNFACDFWERYIARGPANLAKFEQFGWQC